MKPSCISFYMVLVCIGLICLSIPGKTHGSSLVTQKQGTVENIDDLFGKICITDEDCGTFQECKEIDDFKRGTKTCQFNWDWKPILLIAFAAIVVIMGVCLCLF